MEQARWVVFEFERSGLSGQRFAKTHGLHPRRLYYWCDRVLERKSKKDRPSALVELNSSELRRSSGATPGLDGTGRVEIQLLNGRRLTVGEQVDLERLEALVALLEQPPC